MFEEGNLIRIIIPILLLLRLKNSGVKVQLLLISLDCLREVIHQLERSLDIRVCEITIWDKLPDVMPPLCRVTLHAT